MRAFMDCFAMKFSLEGHPQCLHLSLTLWTPLVLVLVLLADELVRLLVRLLHHRVTKLSVLSLQLVAGQVFHNTGADGVSQDICGGS